MTEKKRMYWMPLDWPSYWADTRGFDAEHHGAYLMLLGELWMKKGELRADDPAMAGLAACLPERWAVIGPTILAKFKVVDGLLVQKRLGEEFEHAQKVSAARSEAGKKGAAAKHGKVANATDLPDDLLQQNDAQKQKQKQSPNGDSIGAPPAPPTPAPPPPAPPPPPPPPPAPAPAAPSAPRGSRLPKDWAIPPEWLEVCETLRPDLNPLETADSFRDYWVAKPGKDGVKLDWLATWRNWVRNQRARGAINPTTRDQRAATTAGLGTQFGENHATNRQSPIDVQARVIPDVD